MLKNYEEKYLDGQWQYRYAPEDKWVPMTISELNTRYLTIKYELAQLQVLVYGEAK